MQPLQKLVNDLQEFGDDFVFETAWNRGDSKITGESHNCIYEWISDEFEPFNGKVEENKYAEDIDSIEL